MLDVINETMMMAIIMPASQCDLKLTSFDKGFLSGAVIFGKYLRRVLLIL